MDRGRPVDVPRSLRLDGEQRLGGVPPALSRLTGRMQRLRRSLGVSRPASDLVASLFQTPNLRRLDEMRGSLLPRPEQLDGAPPAGADADANDGVDRPTAARMQGASQVH